MAYKHKFSESDWNSLKQEMREILIGMAKLRQPITYSALAASIQTAYIHHRAPYFQKLINDVCREDDAAGHEVLAVLIVRKDTGICGSGFFTHAAGEGHDVSDPEAFWRTEFDRVCDYWSDL
jgi:hypothetical protein